MDNVQQQGRKTLLSQEQWDHYEHLIGMSLRENRKKLGLSQEELGEMVGLSYQQIQKYERGINRMSLSRGLMCAQAMNVPFCFLYKTAYGAMLGDNSGHQNK